LNQYSNIINNKKVLYAIGIIFLIIYFLPYFLCGENVHVILYDNLDSNVIWFKILAESGKIFSDSMDIIPNMMHGLPRLSYGSEFNVTLWLYYFFNTFTAYVLNDILIHTFAFTGMFLLLNRYIITTSTTETYRNILIFISALLFAYVPFWANGGLSVAGQPLVLYAFLNIRAHKDTKWDWIILLFVPFYSSFILSFFFFLFAVGLFFLYETIKTKTINYRFMLALIFMISLYLLVEYRNVYNMFFNSDFISHRTEFDIAIRSFDACYKNAHLLFLNGQDHNINLQFKYILPLILIAQFLILIKNKLTPILSIIFFIAIGLLYYFNLWSNLLIKEYSLPILLIMTLTIWYKAPKYKIIPFLLLIQIIISYWTGFLMYIGIGNLEDTVPFFHMFHMRFMMIQTLIWYILLGYALKVIIEKIQFSYLLVLFFFTAQITLALEYRNFTREAIISTSYKNYYATSMYHEIEKFIEKDKRTYYILNIGIEPAISLHNGFYTLDGYATNYPLSYKYRFRKIIAPYLKPLAKHFGDSFVVDDWGSKLYVLTGQYVYGLYKERTLHNLPIDIDAVKKLDGKYIFSAYEIEDYKDLNLTFLKHFRSDESYWPVYLYEVN